MASASGREGWIRFGRFAFDPADADAVGKDEAGDDIDADADADATAVSQEVDSDGIGRARVNNDGIISADAEAQAIQLRRTQAETARTQYQQNLAKARGAGAESKAGDRFQAALDIGPRRIGAVAKPCRCVVKRQRFERSRVVASRPALAHGSTPTTQPHATT